MRLYDAHNHLQDERFHGAQDELLKAAVKLGVGCMAVNGSCEEDWPAVLDLAKKHPEVLPSFGYHPWYVRERTERWQERLLQHLEAWPSAIGEIGLDRWIKDFDLPLQEEMFVWQLRLAAERNLPVSIHCLQAWGRIYEILRAEPRPTCGFLLHSYGGPAEMVRSFAELGAYFSFPGYFAHLRKERQRETFRQVPPERLLIETDAPDQLLPEDLNHYPMAEQGTGKALNHPANLASVYNFLAGMFNEPVETLAARVEENFIRLFGTVAGRNSFGPK
jgi:TatD DNase family protein